MREMGHQFTVIAADIDEKAIRHRSPQVLTSRLAMAKCRALLAMITEPSVIITSDQVVVCNRIIREKPRDKGEARRFLESYRTMPAECVTAVYALNTATMKDALAVDHATVWFKDLTDQAIESIIDEEIIFSCAGGFAVGHPTFDPYVERIKGTIDSVMGLPKAITANLILTVQE